MGSKNLRGYQDNTVTTVVGTTHDYLVEEPTGAGKTVEIVAITACLLARRNYGPVLIATPQEHIENNFTKRDYDTLIRTDGSVLSCPTELIQPARDGDEGSIEEIKQYLRRDSDNRYALACTHAALGRINPLSDFPADLSGFTLIIDEAHRMPAMRLSQIVFNWRRNGGRFIEFTATAYRPDGDPVLLDNMHVIRRTLAQHMEEGYAPGQIINEIVAVRATRVDVDQFEGDVPPPEEIQDTLVAEMIKTWKKDGKPKTVVRVPSMLGGSAAMVRKVVEAFDMAGAAVLDVSGQSPADKRRFLDALPSERSLTAFGDSQYDVLVGVQRVTEGLDWPVCSTVYVVGLPGSLLLITQLLGRATRKKTQLGYPAGHAGRAKIAFFVPCGEPSERLMSHHRRSTVLVCAHLSNSTSAAEWCVVKDIGRGIILPISDTELHPTDTVAANYPIIDQKFRAEALATFAAIRAQLLASGNSAPDVDVLELAYQHKPAISRAVLRQVMVEFILEQTKQTGPGAADRVRAQLMNSINDAVASGTPMKNAIRNAFETIVVDLKSFVVINSKTLDDLDRQTITLTGSSIQQIGLQLAEARPISPDWLAKIVEQHFKQHHAYPSVKSGVVDGWPEETWAGIDTALATQKRDWPLTGIRSLSEFTQRYVRYGTLSRYTSTALGVARLSQAERILLNTLMAQQVRISKDETMTLGDTPVPGTSGQAWPKPKWWAVRRWWETHFANDPDSERPPMVDFEAAVFLSALQLFWTSKGQTVPTLVTPEEITALDEKYAMMIVRGEVRSEFAYSPSGAAAPRLESGSEFCGRLVKRPYSAEPERKLRRCDGTVPFKRSDAGYREDDLILRLFLTPAGKIAKQETESLTASTNIPLSWITKVGSAERPARPSVLEKALKDLPGIVLVAPK